MEKDNVCFEEARRREGINIETYEKLILAILMPSLLRARLCW